MDTDDAFARGVPLCPRHARLTRRSSGIRLVYLLPYSPELQPAETLWPLVDVPIVNTLVPTLDDLVNTIGAWCCGLAERQTEISSRTNFAWWPKNHTPS